MGTAVAALASAAERAVAASPPTTTGAVAPPTTKGAVAMATAVVVELTRVLEREVEVANHRRAARCK